MKTKFFVFFLIHPFDTDKNILVMLNEDWVLKLHHDIWKILLFSACSRKDCCNFCILGSLGNEAFPVKIGCCNREICNSLWCVKFLRVPNSNFFVWHLDMDNHYKFGFKYLSMFILMFTISKNLKSVKKTLRIHFVP